MSAGCSADSSSVEPSRPKASSQVLVLGCCRCWCGLGCCHCVWLRWQSWCCPCPVVSAPLLLVAVVVVAVVAVVVLPVPCWLVVVVAGRRSVLCPHLGRVWRSMPSSPLVWLFPSTGLVVMCGVSACFCPCSCCMRTVVAQDVVVVVVVLFSSCPRRSCLLTACRPTPK